MNPIPFGMSISQINSLPQPPTTMTMASLPLLFALLRLILALATHIHAVVHAFCEPVLRGAIVGDDGTVNS